MKREDTHQDFLPSARRLPPQPPLHGEQQPVPETPNDERPGRAMPQANEQHGEHGDRRLNRVLKAPPREREEPTAEGKEKILAEPVGERDMPAIPKLARGGS